MLKELKQNREQKKQELAQSFQSRKDDVKEKYRQHFPKPELEKPTNHLLGKNHVEVTVESNKSTRLIIKFWLI